MGKVAATAFAAVCAFVPSTAYAQVPSFGEAVGFAASGWGVSIAVAVIGYFILKKMDAEAKMPLLLAGGFAFLCYFAGFGGMDWFTFGEFQGWNPLETFDGQTRSYTPGVGWNR